MALAAVGSRLSEARHVSTEALLRVCQPAGAALVLSQQRTSHARYSLLELRERCERSSSGSRFSSFRSVSQIGL